MTDLKPSSYRAALTASSLLFGLLLMKDMMPLYMLLILMSLVGIGSIIAIRKIEGKLAWPNFGWWWYMTVVLCVAIFVWFVYIKN
ncbi:MAG: hypothetical protein J5I59_09815 [Saprospiraceae bacterium]|nr:hypothetical protein [Saprospiraceae bacterium]